MARGLPFGKRVFFYSLELCVDFLFPVTATRKAKDVIKYVKKCIGSRSKTTQLLDPDSTINYSTGAL
jgi:hypothetical protein